MKRLVFVGDTAKVIRKFPAVVGQRVFNQLQRIQSGADPSNWKPMPDVGAGVIEIKIRSKAGAFRVFYVAKFENAVYVIHAFQKKTQKTAKGDIDKGRRRYKDLITRLKE